MKGATGSPAQDPPALPLGLAEAGYAASLPARADDVAGLLSELLAGMLPEGCHFGWAVADDESVHAAKGAGDLHV